MKYHFLSFITTSLLALTLVVMPVIPGPAVAEAQSTAAGCGNVNLNVQYLRTTNVASSTETGSGQVMASGQAIPLVSGGTPVTDAQLKIDSGSGLSIRRSPGSVEFLGGGGAAHQEVEAIISIQGATFRDFSERTSTRPIGTNSQNGLIDNPRDGTWYLHPSSVDDELSGVFPTTQTELHMSYERYGDGFILTYDCGATPTCSDASLTIDFSNTRGVSPSIETGNGQVFSAGQTIPLDQLDGTLKNGSSSALSIRRGSNFVEFTGGGSDRHQEVEASIRLTGARFVDFIGHTYTPAFALGHGNNAENGVLDNPRNSTWYIHPTSVNDELVASLPTDQAELHMSYEYGGDGFVLVYEKTNCQSTASNLTVSSASVMPSVLVVNANMTVNATVANVGAAEAGASVAHLRFDTNADGSWDRGPTPANVKALVVGDQAPVTWVNAWQPPVGTHRLQVCADATNVVAESDETDNCQVLVFTVAAAYSPPPAPVSLCNPVAQTVTVNGAATFQYVPDGQVAWSAPGGTPSSATKARNFTTRYDQPGTYTVTALPAYFYDVDGDGHVHENDVILVRNRLLHPQVPTPEVGRSAWQNSANPFDVNNDGSLTPLDALNIINYLSGTLNAGARILPLTTCTVTVSPTIAPAGPTASFDVPPIVNLGSRITAMSTSQPGTCPGQSCATLTHVWQVTRMSDSANVTPSNNSEPTIDVVGEQLTQYQFTLTVTDSLNRQSTAAKTVMVITTPVGPPSGPHSLCREIIQSVALGQNIMVDFWSSISDSKARWSAPEGNPRTGSGPTFSTSFAGAPAGVKTVTVTAPVPPYYDVNGDHRVTQTDVDDVTAALNSGSPPIEPGTGAGWQNQANRFDVNGDGAVTPPDVLVIINYLNDSGGGPLPALECKVYVGTSAVVPPPPPPASGGEPFNPGPIRETE